MSSPVFRAPARFKAFREHLAGQSLRERDFIVPMLGWSLSGVLLAAAVAGEAGTAATFLLMIHLFALLKFLRAVSDRVQPPVEASFLLFWAVVLLQRLAYGLTAVPTGWWRFLQVIFVASAFFLFCTILMHNGRGKRRTLFFFGFLVLWGGGMLEPDSHYLPILYFAILFFYLLRQTRWLEQLTERECWIYLAGALVLWRLAGSLHETAVPVALLPGEDYLAAIYPRILKSLVELYLLAVVVKLPIVLVYNHAQLSRKLWISGLFQSTFPQFIQFIVLVTIFFFLIAIWQADRLRQNLWNHAQRVVKDPAAAPATPGVFTFTSTERTMQVRLPGHLPLSITAKPEQEGVFRLERIDNPPGRAGAPLDYFYFSTHADSARYTLVLFHLGPEFLQQLGMSSPFLLGTQLRAYPYDPATWETWLYKLDFWSDENKTRVIPFGAVNRSSPDVVSAFLLPDHNEKLESEVNINWGILARNPPTAGRLLIPLYDRNLRPGGIYAIDISLAPTVQYFLSPTFRYTLSVLVLFFILNFFVIRRVVRLGSEINRMIVQKFTILKKGIREISSGNLDYKVALEGDDEFVELASHFNQMGDRLKQSIAEAREKERLEHELAIARKVQISLLPLELPKIAGFEIAAALHTAREVGGDFYDLLPLRNDKYLLTVGDVSGKSTSAAFYMAQCLSLIRYSRQYADDPRGLTLRLNTYFADPLIDKQMFITAIIGELDARKADFKFVRAGHTPPIFIPADAGEPVHEIKANGMGIGLARKGKALEETLEVVKIRLQKGDAIVLYTDGVPEASHEVAGAAAEQEFYGEARFMRLLARLRTATAPALLEAINVEMEQFYRGRPPMDDYTVMIIRRRPE